MHIGIHFAIHRKHSLKSSKSIGKLLVANEMRQIFLPLSIGEHVIIAQGQYWRGFGGMRDKFDLTSSPGLTVCEPLSRDHDPSPFRFLGFVVGKPEFNFILNADRE